MMSHTLLGGSQALSYGTFHLLQWPALVLAVTVLIIVFFILASIVPLSPKHEARHAHEPRHAKVGTPSGGDGETP